MKKTALALLVLSLVLPAGPALAATWADNFNDNTLDPAKWWTYAEYTGSTEETNNHIEYTSQGDAGGGGDEDENFAAISSQATLPVATPWTASVDMHLGDYGSPLDTDYWYGVSLTVFPVGAAGDNGFFVEHERMRYNEPSGLVNVWHAAKETGDNDAYSNSIAAGSDDGRVTVSWDGQYFNAWFDEGGGQVQLASNVDIADWGAVTQLVVSIEGWDEDCDWVLDDGSQMTLDNFELTIVPEPASVTVLLTLALPALIRRRRHR